LLLPDSLRLHRSGVNVWSSLLHITYNNVLILLHRPHPRPSFSLDDPGPSDAEICSAAAGVVANIFEDLREKDQIKFLWDSGVNALFTTMIQLSVEMRFKNPVLAVNAIRRFDSALYSLRRLGEYWLNAESILRLFDDGADRSPKALPEDVAVGEQSTENNGKDPPHHHLRSAAATVTDDQPQRANWPPTPYMDIPPGTSPTNHVVTLDWERSATHNVPVGPPPQQAQGSHEDSQDWRQLFPFSNMDTSTGFPGAELEEQWQEMYWQELGIPSEFGTGAWG